MNNQAPFLDVSSFIAEEASPFPDFDSSVPQSSPFLSLYESLDGYLVDPRAEEYVTFLNELQDEEFDQALSSLVGEAAAIFETEFQHEHGTGYQAERLLDRHFAPLATEAETMFDALAKEFTRRDPNSLTENEIEAFVDSYQPTVELSPNFEEFFGKLKKLVKKVAKKAVSLAKKGVAAVASGGISLILPKLKPLIKPLLKRVIQFAIGKLPASLQPMAKKLAKRLPFLKESEESSDQTPVIAELFDITQIQNEFNQNIANLLFAETELEQDLEVSQLLTAQQAPDIYPVAELDDARNQFVENLRGLKDGEDPTPYIENFIPAILPALKIGIKLIGRKRVVNFLAGLLGKLIQKFVGPQYAGPLSQAIVDAGLRLINLEATSEDETRAAASAVAATIEETVQCVAAAPNYILDNQELLEGFAMDAFEKAAAANLPSILPEEMYRKRPGLIEGKNLRGVWVMMPHITRGRIKRYKKFSRKVPVRITPHKLSAIDTVEGMSMGDVLEEQYGILPGQELEAYAHLYEAIPGTRLTDIAGQDESTAGLGASYAYRQFQPLTREAAEALLGEADLGREVEKETSPYSPAPGERFYYLEVPGKKPLTVPGTMGRYKFRTPSRLGLTLDFPRSEIRVHLFLSEVRAQEIAVKLRQHAHYGVIVTRLSQIIERGLRRALIGGIGRHIKIIHQTVTPDQWLGALKRLPTIVPQLLVGRLQEWILKGLSDQLKQRTEEFIKAAEDTVDGVTLVITLGNPPGLSQLRQALKGKAMSLDSLKLSGNPPDIEIKVMPGYSHE